MNISSFWLIEEEAMWRMCNKAVRISVALTTTVAWFSISNHCALGAFVTAKTQPAMAQMHCHGNQSSPSKKSSGEETPCCKLLRATLVQAGNSVPALDFSAFSLQSDFGGFILFPEESHTPPIFELDTGPPFGGSFAERVLQRSVLAHAPPAFLS